MGEIAERLVTVEEFLAWDDGTDRRYQLLRGAITMMAPAQVIHGNLVVRAGAQLQAKLRHGCSPISEAGIKPPHRADTYYVADLAVTCQPLERGEVHLRHPVLIVEVLSPSTAATDRLLKLDDYRQIPSVTDILLVSSTEIRVDHWHRHGEGWIVLFLGPGESVRLPGLEATLELDRLYEDLALDEPPPTPAD